MNEIAYNISKGFLNLVDAVEGRGAGPGFCLGPSTGDDAVPGQSSGLGPCVGDDIIEPPAGKLGPSIGDDAIQVPLNTLGPCVGDDEVPPSDLRLKCDVTRVGTTVLGLPLHHFKYSGRPETYEGVMAQDVLQVMPAAVSRGADGYYRVNYGLLGIEMRRIS